MRILCDLLEGLSRRVQCGRLRQVLRAIPDSNDDFVSY
jgi:hypothetical protein